jgi:hypothetical protein
MRRALVALVLALAALHEAAAREWTAEERALGAAALALHLADWSQTLRIGEPDNGVHERNPILGPHPLRSEVNVYFAGTTLLMALLAHALPEIRRPLLYGYIAVGAVAVGNNLALGVRVGF